MQQPSPPEFPSRPGDAPPPILVTGSHRSGSTWVGNVLALAPGTGYVHEPFNTKVRAGLCNARFPTDFAYVTRENEAAYLAALRDTLSWRYALGPETRAIRTPRDAARTMRDFGYFEMMRWRGARMIMKDPIALFSTEWLVERFDMQPLVIIRHPAAFVASLIAAGWVKFSFRVFLDQDTLMRDRLEPLRADIIAAVERPPEPLGVAILLWRIIHHHINLLKQDHPDWLFVRHEDLSFDPAEAFRSVYGELGLEFDEKIRNQIESFSASNGLFGNFSVYGARRGTVRNSRDNISYFKTRLTSQQIMIIKELSKDVWPHFYTESEW